MSAVVIEHVKVSELPEDWRTRLHADAGAHVTIRIEEETELRKTPEGHERETARENGENPLFGMWRDREEMADVEAYVRKLRAPRF